MTKKAANDALMTLDTCYDLVVSKKANSIYSRDVESLAKEYLERYQTKSRAARALIRNQAEQCAAIEKSNRFNYGRGTYTSLPASNEALMLRHMYLIASIARIGGYDLSEDDVRTVVYSCLSNLNINEMLKNYAADASGEFSYQVLHRLSDSINEGIKKNISDNLSEAYRESSVPIISDLVSLVKSIIGGSIAKKQAESIGNRAYDHFIATKINQVQKIKNDDGTISLSIIDGRNLDGDTNWECVETDWTAAGDVVVFTAGQNGKYTIKVKNNGAVKMISVDLELYSDEETNE